MKRVTKITGELSGWCVSLIAILLLVGFVSRTVGSPVLWVTEFSQFALIMVIFLGLAICEQNKAHVRVEVLISRFPKRLWQAANIFTYLVALGAIGVVLWGTAQDAWFSFVSKEAASGVVLLPVYPVKFTIVIGIVFYLILLLISITKEFKQPMLKPTEVVITEVEEEYTGFR